MLYLQYQIFSLIEKLLLSGGTQRRALFSREIMNLRPSALPSITVGTTALLWKYNIRKIKSFNLKYIEFALDEIQC